MRNIPRSAIHRIVLRNEATPVTSTLTKSASRAQVTRSSRIALALVTWLFVLAATLLPANSTQALPPLENAPPQAAAVSQPNSDPVYQELRRVTPVGKAVVVKTWL
jgi:hypothetical protein